MDVNDLDALTGLSSITLTPRGANRHAMASIYFHRPGRSDVVPVHCWGETMEDALLKALAQRPKRTAAATDLSDLMG